MTATEMPAVDLVQALHGTRKLAVERREETADVWDELAEACDQLRLAITGANTTGGDPSRQVERASLDDATADQLRADLTTLAHDRSPQRAMALRDRLRALRDELS